MHIGVLGTGPVGETIATALVQKGHLVMMGSRGSINEKAAKWAKEAGAAAHTGTFAEAAAFGEVLFLCLNGAHALDAVNTIGPATVAGKLVFDVTNPLDFSRGMPPRILPQFLEVSLGEQIQEALPEAHVVKALNTINCKVMVAPEQVAGGYHNLFICGNDKAAKSKATDFLAEQFNWNREFVVDIGGISAARTTEAIVPFWVMVMQARGSAMFNFRIVT